MFMRAASCMATMNGAVGGVAPQYVVSVGMSPDADRYQNTAAIAANTAVAESKATFHMVSRQRSRLRTSFQLLRPARGILQRPLDASTAARQIPRGDSHPGMVWTLSQSSGAKQTAPRTPPASYVGKPDLTEISIRLCARAALARRANRQHAAQWCAVRTLQKELKMAILEIAGLSISAIGLFNDLMQTYRDLAKWDEADVEVDDAFLGLALEKGILTGKPDDYALMNIRRVPTAELAGTHSVVIAINKDKRLKYRILRGSAARGEGVNVLVRKIGTGH
ncbi:MAG: hypothetical protein KBA31_13920 [Alphaproteobacteria bacterium]|nr:hypothetical protein [Alphaproteobacteria bacterium]